MKLAKRSFLTLLLMCIMLFGSSLSVLASDLDALVGNDTSTTVTEESSTPPVGSIDLTGSTEKNGTDALIDALQGQDTFTPEGMAQGQRMAGPVIAFLNVLSSFLIIVLLAGIGVTTVLDLIFIGLPITRSLLYPPYNQQVQGGAVGGGGMMSPMGGGFGGFGRSYGMGGMGGMQQQQPQQQMPMQKRIQLVSDEAVQLIGLMQPTMPQQQPMGMGMMAGMQQQQPQQPLGGKSVILAYLKKRTVFLVIFTFAAVFLTSSTLTGFGLRLFSFVQEQLSKIM